MIPYSLKGVFADDSCQLAWEDGERAFCRGWRLGDDGNRRAVLVILPVAERPSTSSLEGLAHEYELKDVLEGSWAVQPLEYLSDGGRTILVLDDPGGEPLDRLMGAPMEVGRFLRVAIGTTTAIGKLHQQGLVHKDIKPSHILVNEATAEVRLTGFGIASRSARERQSPHPPETITGTLAYMAPEQTGRINRSIDSRSDLYALGVTFYQMITGVWPFNATDPMEWVHCHLARRPMAPAERLKEIPGVVSGIIMKLLAKTAEDRYQTAAGLESDLRSCQTKWEAQRQIDDFPLAAHDTPDRLLISEKLYGRQREVETLLATFDRVVKGGAPELVLVSGYSGIGKSSVVNELQPVLVPPRGLFASGKFDQHKRDVPYSTLAQAFQNLVRPLLNKSETDLALWRDALRETLGTNAGLIVDLVPELKLIIGEQPPIPEVPPQDAQRRFQFVFRQFIGMFARPEHPLALFLDDLQWLDAATLDLLEDLLSQSELRHLLLIGAYRDNEITPAHPLMRKLEAIRATERVQDIKLGPLTANDLRSLVADALHCDAEQASPLAELVHAKTDGNPFFVIQFLYLLADEGLLAFDHTRTQWSWNLGGIHAKRYTDNVVELLAGKQTRLPLDTQRALQQLACLGNAADVAMLSIVLEMPEEQVHATLGEAQRQQLIERLEHSYKFVHDRMQEAAYALVPEMLRAEAHLRIGRLLATHIPPQRRAEEIFGIVNQLNRGAVLIVSRGEKEQLAEFNLIAGKRAKASTAYKSGLNYLIAGTALLTSSGWDQRPDLIFDLELSRAECEFLTGDFSAAEERLTMLSTKAANAVDQATVACLRIDLYMTLDRQDRAVEVCLNYLRHRGIAWTAHPTEEEAQREYERTLSLLGDREISKLIDLPLLSEPNSVAMLDVLYKTVTPALNTDANLHSLILCRMINLSLEHGNSDASCYGYVWLGTMVGVRSGDYQAGFRFGQLGYDLVEQRGLRRFQARTYMGFGVLVFPWTKHLRDGRDLIRQAFDVANTLGDLTYAGYSQNCLIANLLAAGDRLADVQREAERGLEFAQKAQIGLVTIVITAQLALIHSLRGLTAAFGGLDDTQFSELGFELEIANERVVLIAACWYWIRKLQARFFAGQYETAVEASLNAQKLLWTSPCFFETAEAHFYGALSHAAICDVAFPDQYRQHIEALTAHHKQLLIWVENCPENFEDRAVLVGAEIARLEGRELDAERLYEKAIKSARKNEFVHNEALANELAARFYAARGFETVANAYMREARSCYRSWGAEGKVRQLETLYPLLREPELVGTMPETIAAPVEHLDIATVVKVSQTVSGEMDQEKLIDALTRLAIEHAGAERGLLLLLRADHLEQQAEATTDGDGIVVRQGDPPAAAFPQSIVQYVMRSREVMLLDDASAHPTYSSDSYVLERNVRSILCLPLADQAKVTGVLYLENNLAPNVFTPDRVTILKVLASQAAISLENSRLYHDLADREARIRRLVDANILGIGIYTVEGAIVEANDALLKMLQFGRDDVVSGRLRWTDLTPAEWRERNERAVAQLRAVGTFQPFENELFRRDGSRIPVLIGGALFEGSANEGVAFVLDLTERKQAEEALRELQSTFAHINRVSMMGELAASLSHEITQPIASARNNVRVAQILLKMQPPDLHEVREALACVVGDVNRAGDIIGRIRQHMKKAPLRKDRFDLDEAIREMIVLAQTTLTKNGVSVQTCLMEGLLPVYGDRIQLQQVILNLILNAVEAMDSVGVGARELLISSEEDDTGVLVAVRDTGPGIDPTHLERIFQAFYTTKSSGMGMGLSVCRSIIDAHGGKLWAEANEPRGAVFQFTLPAAQEDS